MHSASMHKRQFKPFDSYKSLDPSLQGTHLHSNLHPVYVVNFVSNVYIHHVLKEGLQNASAPIVVGVKAKLLWFVKNKPEYHFSKVSNGTSHNKPPGHAILFSTIS